MENFKEGMVLLRRPDVEKKTGMKRSMIYALMQGGDFPRPVKLSRRSVAWVETAIDQWIADKIQQSNSGK